MMNHEVGDIVLCTVDRIVGTIVFVRIESGEEGGIIFSEIAPGRIRNIRDYVVPKKQIVCKILRISGDRIDLSLRRVSQKERKETLEEHKQEKGCKSVLKSVLGQKAESVIKEILKEDSVHEFCERIKENTKELEKFVDKTEAKKIQDILKTQKKKKAIVKKEFSLTSTDSNGLTLIKTILGKVKNTETKYVSAGIYTMKAESENPKKADGLVREELEKIEKESKKNGLFFSIREK